jgi:hypothetical protein
MWTAFIANNKKWTSIFGDNYTPKNLNISYAILKDHSITLKLNSPLENDKAPLKWIKNGCNEFEFDLLLNHINSIEISKFSFYGPICITIEKKSTEHEICIKNLKDNILKCTANSVFISNVNAYHNDHSE